jgi:hypothetical protein
MEAKGQFHSLAALLPGERALLHPLHIAIGGPQSRSGSCGENMIPCPCRESKSGRPAHSPSLYRLSYPGSLHCESNMIRGNKAQ